MRFIAGLILLVVGAEALVRGGSDLARRLGMSRLMIGLTIVALGTSAPELVVSVTASATGNGDVALGNVLGSNILNTLIVLGITAVVAPLAVTRQTVRHDLPLVAAVSVLAWMFLWDGILTRMEGLLLAAMVIPFLYNLYEHRRGRDYQPIENIARRRDLAYSLLAVSIGVAMLVLGGDMVVRGGTSIAATLGVPDRIIALTLVAFGTSAPELATSLVAAFRRHVDLAVGNAVGSNLLNLFMVLGVSGMVAPIPAGAQSIWLDAPVMILGALLLLRFAATRFHITRTEGFLLIGLYGGYLILVALA